MGSCFCDKEFDGNLTRDQLTRAFKEFKDEEEYEHGHDAYNGTLSTTSGLEIRDQVFDDADAASEYIEKNTEKWESALAVRFKVNETVFKKQPTFGGRKSAESLFEDHQTECIRKYWDGKRIVSPADQCTASQKTRLMKLWGAFKVEAGKRDSLRDEFCKIMQKFGDIKQDPTPEDYKRLRRIRPEIRKANAKARKAKEKLIELDKKLAPRICVREQKNLGIKWLVGGWCAE
jgi:hypothetical protein